LTQGTIGGFTLIERLVVILMALVLCWAPVYVGYAVNTKVLEGKTMASALWTAVRTSAIRSCGTDIPVNNGYPRVGLTSTGQTTPERWSVSAGGTNTLSADCGSGQYTASASPLFVIKGDSEDVNSLRVQVMYSPAGTPPSRLQCSKDGGTTFVDC
jgi:hypothetical protein